MLSSVEHRRTSVFADARWQGGETCDKPPHSIQSQVYDKGFALAALLQDFDNLNLTDASTSVTTLSQCLKRVVDMDSELENWFDKLLDDSPSPSCWPKVASTFTRGQQKIAISGPRGLPLLFYPNLTMAIISVTVWALKIVISDEIATICRIVLFTNREARADAPTTDPATSLMLTSMAQRIEDQHSEEKRMNLAIDIVRSMPYCCNENMGLLGPERAVFALRTALNTMRRIPGPELDWLEAADHKIDRRSKFVERYSFVHTCTRAADLFICD